MSDEELIQELSILFSKEIEEDNQRYTDTIYDIVVKNKNIINDLKQKNNLAENILYDYLYNDDKITKEKYEQFKELKEGK